MPGVRRSGARGGGRSSSMCGVGLRRARRETDGPDGIRGPPEARCATGSSRGARVRRATRPWRTAVLGNVGGGATARKRAKRRRGNGVELTASSSAVSLGSGTGCGRHIGDGDRRCPRFKMMSMAAIRRVPGCLTRRGGVEGGGGALGHARWRRKQWPRQLRAAAVVALGRERERGQMRGEARERVREVHKGAWRR